MPMSKKKPLVGLDIGSHSIKLVEIAQTKRGRLLQNFGVIHTPPGAVLEGAIKDPAAIATAINRLYKNLRVRNSNVTVSLSGYSVIAKKITIDRMEESKIEVVIQQEAEKYIPYDINEVNLDFAVLDAAHEPWTEKERKEGPKGGNQMDVLLVAAKRDVIDEYVGLIQAADLNPVVMDADIFALQNAVEISLPEPEKCFAIINLGASELEINVVSRGVSIFSRDSSYGGGQITEAIRSEFKVDMREAEQIKLGGKGLDAKQEAVLSRIFSHAVASWAKEIKRAIDFVSSTRVGDPVQKIVVSGGSCRINGLQEYLEMEAGVPVEALNPFRNLVIDHRRFDAAYLEHMALQAGVAVGLALRAMDDK